MNAEQFASWLTEHRQVLETWGKFVTSAVCEQLQREMSAEHYSKFLKIRPEPRVKEEASALRKLEKKRYAHPAVQMTDLVGVRFVTLLRSDLELLDRVIIRSNQWSCTRDRHFEQEVFADPEVFDYQSVHYVVRCPEDTDIDGVLVPAETACEIQVRTLLQHAYAELVHDRVYKPSVRVPVNAKRMVARCMALMESTDDFFCQAVQEIDAVVSTREQLLRVARESYELLGLGPGVEIPHLAAHLIDTYLHLLDTAQQSEIKQFSSIAILRKRIAERAATREFFAEPVCLLVYWLVKNHHPEVVDRWDLPGYQVDLESICSDLGMSGR